MSYEAKQDLFLQGMAAVIIKRLNLDYEKSRLICNFAMKKCGSWTVFPMKKCSKLQSINRTWEIK